MNNFGDKFYEISVPYTFDKIQDRNFAMKAYLINLDSRPDRLEQSILQSKYLGFELVRISALDFGQISDKDFCYVSRSVGAIWSSHIKALNKFLESDDEFALILEDDFIIDRLLDEKYLKRIQFEKFDFLQLGFLQINLKDRFDVQYYNYRDTCLKLLTGFCKKSKFLQKRYGSRRLVLEQIGVRHAIVISDIRPGTQAYVISRNFAKAMLEINSPVFLSADLLYMSLGTLRTFSMARTRKSVINQSDSPSSVISRFIN